jgi:hypothetical protein
LSGDEGTCKCKEGRSKPHLRDTIEVHVIVTKTSRKKGKAGSQRENKKPRENRVCSYFPSETLPWQYPPALEWGSAHLKTEAACSVSVLTGSQLLAKMPCFGIPWLRRCWFSVFGGCEWMKRIKVHVGVGVSDIRCIGSFVRGLLEGQGAPACEVDKTAGRISESTIHCFPSNILQSRNGKNKQRLPLSRMETCGLNDLI